MADQLYTESSAAEAPSSGKEREGSRGGPRRPASEASRTKTSAAAKWAVLLVAIVALPLLTAEVTRNKLDSTQRGVVLSPKSLITSMRWANATDGARLTVGTQSGLETTISGVGAIIGIRNASSTGQPGDLGQAASKPFGRDPPGAGPQNSQFATTARGVVASVSPLALATDPKQQSTATAAISIIRRLGGLDEMPVAVLQQPTARITALAALSDREVILAGQADGRVVAFDVSWGRTAAPMDMSGAHPDGAAVVSIAVAAKPAATGASFATAAADGSVRVWHATKTGFAADEAVAFGPNERWAGTISDTPSLFVAPYGPVCQILYVNNKLIVLCQDRVERLDFDTPSKKFLVKSIAQGGGFSDETFVPFRSNYFLTITGDAGLPPDDEKNVLVWIMNIDQPRGETYSFDTGGTVPWGLAISADGKLLAVGYDNQVTLIDRKTSVRRVIPMHDSVTAIAFSPSGGHLATATREALSIRELATNKEVRIPWRPSEIIRQLAFSADGERVIAAAADGGWASLSANGINAPMIGGGPPKPPDAPLVVLKNDGSRLLRSASGGGLEIVDTTNGYRVATLDAKPARASFDDTGRKLATLDREGRLSIWSAGEITRQSLPLGPLGNTSLFLSADGLVFAVKESSGRLWLARVDQKTPATSAATLSRGSRAEASMIERRSSAPGEASLRARVLPIATSTGPPAQRLPEKAAPGRKGPSTPTPPLDAPGTVSPGRQNAPNPKAEEKRPVAAADIVELRPVSLPFPAVSVALSPDGTRLAIGGDCGGLRLQPTAAILRTAVASGAKSAFEISGHAAPVTQLAFSPDGKTLASASLDGRLYLTDIAAAEAFWPWPLYRTGTLPCDSPMTALPLDHPPDFEPPDDQPSSPANGAIVFGSDRSAGEADAEIRRATAADLAPRNDPNTSGLRIYLRGGYYVSVAVFASQADAAAKLAAFRRLSRYSAGARLVTLSTWCPQSGEPTEAEGGIKVYSCKDAAAPKAAN